MNGTNPYLFLQKYMNYQTKGLLIPVTQNSVNWIYTTKEFLKGSLPVGLIVISYPVITEKLNNGSLSGSFGGWDENIYITVVRKYGVAFRIILIIVVLFCLFWAMYKIYGLITHKHFAINIASVCLCLEVLNGVLRLVGPCNYLNRIVTANSDPLISTVGTSFTSFAFGFNLSSGIFIIYFWMSILSLKLYSGNILERSFWPSFVLVAIIWLLLFLFGLFYILGILSQLLVSYLSGVILVLCAILAVFYFITARLVFNYTKKRSDSKGLKTIAIKIVLSGVCFLLIIINTGLILMLQNKPLYLYNEIISLTVGLLFSARSLLQIDVFGTLKQKGQQVVITNPKDVTPTKQSLQMNTSDE